ncbi:hypothetical protein F5144DRAFT_148397 [Chaetomium tenue]|uniref:Uncharacterized protein n=1 Tax=Chaetomium tenue TaxID=1854479 RepID=A0ACB7PIK9_9PEZI|nr:hypothetical protein F5144DRAFT_148397 [Chaetomium globosum]
MACINIFFIFEQMLLAIPPLRQTVRPHPSGPLLRMNIHTLAVILVVSKWLEQRQRYHGWNRRGRGSLVYCVVARATECRRRGAPRENPVCVGRAQTTLAGPHYQGSCPATLTLTNYNPNPYMERAVPVTSGVDQTANFPESVHGGCKVPKSFSHAKPGSVPIPQQIRYFIYPGSDIHTASERPSGQPLALTGGTNR